MSDAFNPNSPSAYSGLVGGVMGYNAGQGPFSGVPTGGLVGGNAQPAPGIMSGGVTSSPYFAGNSSGLSGVGNAIGGSYNRQVPMGMPTGYSAPNMGMSQGTGFSNFDPNQLGQFSGANQQNPTAGSGGQWSGANNGAFGTGSVGQANYGSVAAIQNLLQQNPAAAGYLRAMGMMPSINGVPLDQAMNGTPVASVTNGGRPNPGYTRDAQGNYHMPDGSIIGNDGRSQIAGPGGVPVGSGQGQSGPSLSQQLTSYQRTPSPFEQQTQNQISNMYQNPTGFNQQQQQQLYTNATNPIAYAQQQAMQDTRANAVQRGAATSDADIADQLNRVRMSGANAASQANQNVGLGLASASRQGTLGALSAANPLINSQLRDTSDLRNTLLGANSVQQQLGQGNLNLLLGSRF